MQEWVENLLDEKNLKKNIEFASLFILNYECLKDFIVNQIRDFYCNHFIFDNGKTIREESDDYKRNVRSLDKQIDNASMKWFFESEAISEDDYELYQKIRIRRNEITHELFKSLEEGFNEKDTKLFNDLVQLYNKLDKWWINEIEIPTSAEDIPKDYDATGVMGGQALFLSAINDIVISGDNGKYQEILKAIRDIKY